MIEMLLVQQEIIRAECEIARVVIARPVLNIVGVNAEIAIRIEEQGANGMAWTAVDIQRGIAFGTLQSSGVDSEIVYSGGRIAGVRIDPRPVMTGIRKSPSAGSPVHRRSIAETNQVDVDSSGHLR